MNIQTSSVLMGLCLASSSAFAGPNAASKWSWTCTDKAGSRSVKIAFDAGKNDVAQILSAKVDGYHVIENGKQLEDRKIGSQVFGVGVGNLEWFGGNGSILKFSLSLHDYSDSMAWTVWLQDYGNGQKPFAEVQSAFQSSDGDNQLHLDHYRLDCQIL